MIVGSVCSGIGAPELAWRALGWRFAWQAETDPAAARVLARHFPDVPNFGDLVDLPGRVLQGEIAAPDVLVGGTPCQSFSVAGLRRGLADERGNLARAFCELANAIDAVRRDAGRPPCWILWENVPGVFSDDDNAFGAILGGLVGSASAIVPHRAGWVDAGVAAGPARGAAWRTMDAQYCGLAQRRRRVFVLARGGAGNLQSADALLPITNSMRWHPRPRRQSAEDVARTLTAGAGENGGSSRYTPDSDTLIPIVFQPRIGRNGRGYDEDVVPSLAGAEAGATSDMRPCVAYVPGPTSTEVVAFAQNQRDELRIMDVAGALAAEPGVKQQTYLHVSPAVSAFQQSQSGMREHETHATLDANNGSRRYNGALIGSVVRRLMPIECERLQGFPDGWTDRQSDTARYRQLGNSMAVPVIAYIGERIAAVDGRS